MRDCRLSTLDAATRATVRRGDATHTTSHESPDSTIGDHDIKPYRTGPHGPARAALWCARCMGRACAAAYGCSVQ